jgi:hypothetical protein
MIGFDRFYLSRSPVALFRRDIHLGPYGAVLAEAFPG